METIEATIEERGNGLPTAGDYVGGEGNLYRVVSINGRIHTGHAAGCANYVHATVELVDWSACDEDDEFPAAVIVAEVAE